MQISLPQKALSLSIFCKVIDNFGDIGICWRLACQITAEHDVAVTLWVDDLVSFRRIMPALRVELDWQSIAGITVRHWHEQVQAFSIHEIPDVVIEFFGCDIPETYIAAMARRDPLPVWLNLEGLTAEKWVEGCHRLPSPHPRFPLTKWFFFPGFNERTGGLPRESGLLERCTRFQGDRDARGAFLEALGATPAERHALTMSLFCYPHAPVTEMFSVLAGGTRRVTCMVPEGVASNAVEKFLGEFPAPGVARTQGALTVRILPFVPQPDYDRLLWACDFNVVRGEDSFVRAQWAGRPFLWHIYPQDKQLHHVKLKAFLDIYRPDVATTDAMSMWNDLLVATGPEKAAAWFAAWQAFLDDLPRAAEHAAAWRDGLLAQDDLVVQLLRFVAAKQAGGQSNRL